MISRSDYEKVRVYVYQADTAHPIHLVDEGDGDADLICHVVGGLTKAEYAAVHLLAALVSRVDDDQPWTFDHVSDNATHLVEIARKLARDVLAHDNPNGQADRPGG